MKTRRCKDCGTTAPLTDFYSFQKSGEARYWSTRCKQCYNKRYGPEAKTNTQRYRATKRGRANALLHHARMRAGKNKLEFDLTLEWLEPRMDRCEATGIDFDLSPQGTRNRNPFAPSLDRTDSKRGYTQGNTKVVVMIHNCARGQWGTAALHEYIKKYLKHLAKRGT